MQIAALFGRPLTGYGLGAACAVLACWLASWLYLRGKKVPWAHFCVYALCTALCGWLMSRVVFALCSIPTYINEYDGYFAPALFFWDGGYAITGALLGAALGACVAARLTGQRRGMLLNAVGFGLPLSVAVLRLTEFLVDTAESGDVGEGDYIAEDWLSDLLGQLGLLMKADGDFCYPVCLLECLFAAALFIGLIIWLCRSSQVVDGDVLMVSLMFFCLTQIIAEPLRDDGHLTFHFVPFQQVIALVVYVVLLTLWLRRLVKAGDKRLALTVGVLASVCIIVGVIASFMIDRYENKIVAWSLLIGPMIILGGLALHARARANSLQGA